MAKNYKRRHVLKYAAGTAVGATVRGTIGGIIGKAYEYTIQPAVDLADDMVHHPVQTTKTVSRNLFDRFIAYGSDTPQTKQEERAREQAEKEKEQHERYSRRGFLGKIIYGAHRHPTAAGIATGVGYSAAKGLVVSTYKYHELDKEKRTLHEKIDQLEKTVTELREEREDAHNRTRKKDGMYGPRLDFAIFGLAIISGIFIMYFTGNVTGYSILGTNASLGALIPAVIAGMIIFVFSIVYILTRD